MHQNFDQEVEKVKKSIADAFPKTEFKFDYRRSDGMFRNIFVVKYLAGPGKNQIDGFVSSFPVFRSRNKKGRILFSVMVCKATECWKVRDLR